MGLHRKTFMCIRLTQVNEGSVTMKADDGGGLALSLLALLTRPVR
jgi:hypothetical protein